VEINGKEYLKNPETLATIDLKAEKAENFMPLSA
jgi:hypothetical protein